ncbi:MAG: lantibiotic immunity ABC transporter MutG family permease subunit [Eubacterium sp.]|nr:lantibiotic immunity ABC transporter MutG family permease subunit [Eubacterium sp.]
MLFRCLRVDLLKMKRLPITYAHIVIPILISAMFLAYYKICGWNDQTKISAFYEAVGIGFPVLIGIFTASLVELEQSAGAYQNILSVKHKITAFVSKVIILNIYSLFSLVLTTLIFGTGMSLSGTSNLFRVYLTSTALIWLAGIPLYIWQMVIAFRLGKGASIGVGILGGLVSALMMTGLGERIWRFIPAAWTTRIPASYLQGVDQKSMIINFTVVTLASIVYYVLWAFRWEGKKISE